jgi:hypothetical protein
MSESAIRECLAEAFVRGTLVAVFREHTPLDLLPWREEETEEEAPAKDGEIYRCSVQVVLDATDEPLPDIALTLRLADGTEVELATDGNGLAELDDAYRGTFDATSRIRGATLEETFAFTKSGATPSASPDNRANGNGRPPTGKWLARVIEHRVHTGETLASIAEAHGLTRDKLAYFNWSTTDPDAINACLGSHVGCTVTEEDGETYRLDDSDAPGIVRIPLPWKANGLPHDQTYIVRVAPILVPHRFARCIDVAEQPIVGKPYVIYDGKYEVHSGYTQAGGWIETPFARKGTHEVRFHRAEVKYG